MLRRLSCCCCSAPWRSTRRRFYGAGAAAAAAVEEEPHGKRLMIAQEVRSLFEDVDQERIRQGVEGLFVDGKFRGVMRNVIATPSNLMAAYNSIKKRSGPLLSDESRQMQADGITPDIIQQMSRDMAIGTFDVKANCIELPVSNKESSARTLVLPNLKTKIAMEAIRMALQEIYEPRFSSFSFAARPGRGRHMAMRMMKYRWKYLDWFVTMRLERRFMLENMDILVSIIEETIEDSRLTAFLQQLFRARVFQMDMGNLHWEDFCKEPILSPLLLNIYLDKLDSKIMEVGQGVASMNPPEPDDVQAAIEAVPDVDIGIVEEPQPYKLIEDEVRPKVRLFACRYGDEILLGISGQKEIALTVQQELILYANEKLVVEVDRGRFTLRNASTHYTMFLGFQLKFVPPSKMPEFRKQTCIQSMRAVQNRVEMVKRQMKNHFDAVVRKMGGEMLVNIYKRARKNAPSDGAGDEMVKRMFQSIAGDVVRGFLSTEREFEKSIFRERMRKGHYLLSPWIRQQLPPGLNSAFDKFQEEADKFLGEVEVTVESSDVNERLEQRQVKRERMAEARVAKAAGLPPPIKPRVPGADEMRLLVTMPEMELVDRLRLRELVTKGGKAAHFRLMLAQEDIAIIQWYAALAHRWLDYFRCCDNFAYVKKTVDFHLRWSLLHSLGAKHKCPSNNIKKMFTSDIKVVGLDGNLTAFFPTAADLRNVGRKFLCPPVASEDTKCGDQVLFLVYTRMSRAFLQGRCCSVIGCYSGLIDMYLMRVHKVLKRIQVDSEEWMEVVRVGTLHSVYDWKAFPLCFEHYLELLSGRVSITNVRPEAITIPTGGIRRMNGRHGRKPLGVLVPPEDQSDLYA